MKHPIRIGCAVPTVTVADPDANARAICAHIAKGAEEKCDLLVFPELCVTGYTCADLFFQKLLIRSAAQAVERIVACSAQALAMHIVIGAPLMLGERLYDCALVLRGGSILGIVPKLSLSHGEQRWFSNDTPATPDLRFSLSNGTPFRVAFDLEQPCDTPIAVHPIAQPALAESRHRENVQRFSAANRCVCASVSAGPTESGQDMVYSGHSLVASNGAILAQRFLETDSLLLQDVDLNALSGEPQFPAPWEDSLRPDPFYHGEAYCRDIFRIQVAGLARRLKQLGCKPVIGVSGGLDSTLALLVAVEAVKQNGRPASDVCAVTMPGFGTSGRTYDNASALMDLLGVSVKEVSIRQAVQLHFADIGHDISVRNATYENAQARERTQILMDYASVVGGTVVGTGDLSELALGWCTYNGDHMSMYGVNGSIPKTLVRKVVAHVADNSPAELAAILRDILDTPVSPELLPAETDGSIKQKTEDIVGPYELHDFYLFYTVRRGFAPEKIRRMAIKAFEGVYDEATIDKWLSTFLRRFFSQQFKRSCLPDGPKVGSVALSPRGDWRMPSDASSMVWMNNAK